MKKMRFAASAPWTPSWKGPVVRELNELSAFARKNNVPCVGV